MTTHAETVRIVVQISSTCGMPRAGFEPAAFPLGGGRSVQLSYRGRLQATHRRIRRAAGNGRPRGCRPAWARAAARITSHSPAHKARAARVEAAARRRVGRRRQVAAEHDAAARPCAPAPDRRPAPPTAAPRCTDGAGARRARSAVASSTILPRYITATRSHMWRTTDRSWAMKTIVRPRSRCSAAQQVEDLRLDRDVERRHRLVGDDRASGRSASARATPMRWRWPPENSCG